ncbi:MAG: TetR/AcrR family transcriptional regulator [Hamadaea sp.]|uniref:TetR/AcrR family transcriptional regulator n=1 Tax=Hamadaea sp. TaxID=2024425 RepID=UPI0017E38B9A|nr:TetR/AcrR family transcriptional regulator [Hamadaea sp.]NUR73156.1 TetR/AcrR family transcriptional regulator [Hamadaea sp.]NUT18478.1 TetR/AcrR family transcriptional regulator [Hamadaea sp.]
MTQRSSARERILRAAILALSSHGYAGTTARSIAALGGFAPGVIYYHFADLDEVFTATAAYTSELREERYRAALAGVTKAVPLIRALRTLYAEDLESGHIEAVQELVAAARPGSPLAAAMAAQTRQWELLAEEILARLLRGKPLGRLVNVPTAARAAVAYYLGMQTLTHIDGDASRPEAAFAQAARLAAAFDKLPALRRRPRPSRRS